MPLIIEGIAEALPSLLTMLGLGYLVNQTGTAASQVEQGTQAVGEGVQSAADGLAVLGVIFIAGKIAKVW